MVDLTPNHYNILLEPDLETFRFKGKTEITISADEPISELDLHSLDLEIIECSVASNGSSQNASWNVDLKNQALQLKFENKVQDFIVKVNYIGEINEHLAGFYRSKYTVHAKITWREDS